MATTTKRWEQRRRKIDELPADEQAEIRRKANEGLSNQIETHERSLAEVRRARAMTQVQLGKVLGVSQAQVSRIENQADLYLSTLVSYINAMGGSLELVARFEGDPDWTVVNVGELIEQEGEVLA